MKNNVLKTTEVYKKEVIDKYGDVYDLSELVYKSAKEKVKIGCHSHGFFEQEASYFLNKSLGCPSCARAMKKQTNLNTKSFIIKALKVHGNLYNYDKVIYIKSNLKVKIICKVHGVFEQTPNNHLRNRGCNACRSLRTVSKAEVDLRLFLEQQGYEIISNARFSWLDGKELDIFIPSLGLAIEYNGFVYHHSSLTAIPFLKKTYVPADYHLNKYLLCKKHGISLLHVFEFEDIEEWKQILKKITKKSFKVSFENTLRTITLFNKSLDFYGISKISHIV